jgi:hypothetical protein
VTTKCPTTPPRTRPAPVSLPLKHPVKYPSTQLRSFCCGRGHLSGLTVAVAQGVTLELVRDTLRPLHLHFTAVPDPSPTVTAAAAAR